MSKRKKIVTTETERKRSTMIGVLISAVVVGVVGVAYNNPPVARPVWLTIAAVVVVAAIVVAVLLLRRPRPLVKRVTLNGVKPDVRRMQRRIERQWTRIARDARITDEDHTAADVIAVKVPQVVNVEPVPLGLRLTVKAIPGQRVEHVAAAAPRLESALGVPVRARPIGPAIVEIDLVLSNPLAGVRRTATPSGVKTAIVIGRCDDGTDAVIDLADASHIAVQGTTGTGKSYLMYCLLSQIGVKNPGVQIVGIDPNSVLLGPLAEASGREQDFVLGANAPAAIELLDRTCAILDQRITDLHREGIDKLERFTEDRPLLVVVLEEYGGALRIAAAYDETVPLNERIAGRIKSRVARLVTEGAKAGIRVVLITQRMDASTVDGDSRGQFGTRLTFGVDNGDAVQMLHPSASPETIRAVIDEFEVGEALIWRHRREKRMKADLTEYDAYRARLGLAAENCGES